jgi:hypothetical protein
VSEAILKELRQGKKVSVTSFHISANLTEFPRELFELEETLEFLDLGKNRLSSLPEDFHRFSKLKTLFLSENKFTEIPEVLGKCTSITMIGFKSNQISTVPENSLPTSCDWLILTDNIIVTLPDSMGELVRLRKVALAGNQITHLPSSMSNCVNLELLRISANQLTEIPEWLLTLPKLTWLAFSGNPCSVSSAKQEQLNEIHWDDIELHEVLGQGASGVISKAVINSDSPQEAAVKLFKGEITSDGYPQDEMDACISAGQHPHLVPLIGKISGHPEKEGVVLEYIPQSFSVLGNPPSFESCTRDVYHNDFKISSNKAETIISGVTAALGHLHTKGILHGDLYAHNTMINDEGYAYLGDFGAATRFDPLSPKAKLLKKLDLRALEHLKSELRERIIN